MRDLLLNRLDLAIVLAAGDGTRMKSTTAKVATIIQTESIKGDIIFNFLLRFRVYKLLKECQLNTEGSLFPFE